MESIFYVDFSFIGGRTYPVDSEEEAKAEFVAVFSDAVVFGEWEFAGFSQQRHLGERYRKLVWENEATAGEPGTGEDGSHTCGEIIRYDTVEK